MRKTEFLAAAFVVLGIATHAWAQTAPGLSNETEGGVASYMPWLAVVVVIGAILGYLFYRARQTTPRGSTDSRNTPRGG